MSKQEGYKILVNEEGKALMSLAFSFLSLLERIPAGVIKSQYVKQSKNLENLPYLYITLFTHGSLFKCRMYAQNSFKFYYGTKELFWSDKFEAYKQLAKRYHILYK